MKPILACDVDFAKLNFPLMMFPKIDGVRALNVDGRLVGRSGKQFKNKLNTEFFSDERFNGFDGEMVVDRITGYGICNETTSALGTIKGTVETRWCLFDYIIEGFNDKEPYHIRYNELNNKVHDLILSDSSLASRIWVIPYELATTIHHIEETELNYLEQQYEGLILRNPSGVYKNGRTTAKECNYLRLKRFFDAEIVVTGIVEGRSNHNELKQNPNGYAERSTIAENMIPNGMVGTIIGEVLEEQKLGDIVVLSKGQIVEVSPGKMTHKERQHFFENQDQILGQIVKFQYFPVGIKDKPRFPTYQGFRDPIDL